MIHNRITSEHWAVCQMQRAWDIPKIAVCPDSGCACYSLKSQYPQIMMSPLLRKRGHFFLLRYLKKRQRNVRCIVEGFLKISRSFFRTKGENMSVCYMEGKFFALPPNLQKFVRCKVKGNQATIPSFSKFYFRHYQVLSKKCPLYCERSVSICQTARDPSARKSA